MSASIAASSAAIAAASAANNAALAASCGRAAIPDWAAYSVMGICALMLVALLYVLYELIKLFRDG